METKDVQLQGQAELISIFSSYSHKNSVADAVQSTVYHICCATSTLLISTVMLSGVTRGLRQGGQNLAEGDPPATLGGHSEKKFKKRQ